MSFASQPNPAQTAAQATLQHSLNALNAKIVQAQSLALINGISVDDVLSRMGGLNEIELGLLKLCAAREQEARLQANLLNQQQQMQQIAFLQQQQQQIQQQQLRNPGSRASYQEPPRQATRTTMPAVENSRQRSYPAQDNSTGWEEGFASLTLGGENKAKAGRTSPPTVNPATQASGKHAQAATWRSAAPASKQQTVPVSPVSIPVVRGEQAVKGFNGVFGNKVVPARKTSDPIITVREKRSGSASSGSSEGTLHGGNRMREVTFASSTSSLDSVGTPPPVLITPPCMPSEHTAGGRNNKMDGYFGSKKVVADDAAVTAMRMARNAVGVIGQGFGPSVVGAQVGMYGVVIRQPHGPPGGADELGNKNFASRLRQKAVSDLGVLGRRRANSPAPQAITA